MSKTKSIRNLVSSPSTGDDNSEGAIRITPILTISRKGLSRNVILRSGATKNLLFGFVVSGH